MATRRGRQVEQEEEDTAMIIWMVGVSSIFPVVMKHFVCVFCVSNNYSFILYSVID